MSAAYGNLFREKERRKNAARQRWNLAVEPLLPAAPEPGRGCDPISILYPILPLDLLTAMILCCQRQQSIVCIFSREFCPQWPLTTQCTDGQRGLCGGGRVETLIFLSSKKAQANRKICLLSVRQRWKNETIQLAKTTQ